MKKLFLTLCIALFSVGAFAQEQGDMAVGGSLNFNTKASMFGIGARYQYFFIDKLRGDGEFAYYFKKDGVSMFTILASANYLFNVADKVNVYPIAGLGIAHSSASSIDINESYMGQTIHITSNGASSTDFIGQIGAGAQYDFSDKVAGNFDAKLQFGSGTAFVIAAGIIYKF
jgi:outer membrane protein X